MFTAAERSANSGAWLPCFVAASAEAVATATCSVGVRLFRAVAVDGASGGLSTSEAARGVSVT